MPTVTAGYQHYCVGVDVKMSRCKLEVRGNSSSTRVVLYHNVDRPVRTCIQISRKHCWTCSAAYRHTTSPINDSRDDTARHEHLPCCNVASGTGANIRPSENFLLVRKFCSKKYKNLGLMLYAQEWTDWSNYSRNKTRGTVTYVISVHERQTRWTDGGQTTYAIARRC